VDLAGRHKQPAVLAVFARPEGENDNVALFSSCFCARWAICARHDADIYSLDMEVPAWLQSPAAVSTQRDSIMAAGKILRTVLPAIVIMTVDAGVLQAQNVLPPVSEFWQTPASAENLFYPSSCDGRTPASDSPRLRLFGMPAGFIANPLGLKDDDDIPATDPAAAKVDDDFQDVQLSLGYDNPILDPMRPGNVGGVGYYRIYSQVRMFDWGATSACVNFQAFTPAGAQWGGLPNGPTYFSPAFSWFHDLGAGTALQGFVWQNICTGSGWEENWNRRLFYGLAWQCPLIRDEKTGDQGLYFFVQAMGRFHYDTDASTSKPAVGLIPGLQWRVSDNCWMSVGGGQRGIISCSWQF
jgi:hypothetical protein